MTSADKTTDERHLRVPRYSGSARINHWTVAATFVLLTLSGLALYLPSLYFLTGLFGGGQNTRAIHPWLGCLLVLAFAGLFVRFFSQNLPESTDLTWLSRAGKVIDPDGEKFLPEVGKYNAGQKIVFWSQAVLITILLITGLALWQQGLPYIESVLGFQLSLETRRWAAVIHATAATLSIVVWIVHVYSAIWVRGTMPAMVEGSVSGGWSWKHHRRWLRNKVAEGDIEHTGSRNPAE